MRLIYIKKIGLSLLVAALLPVFLYAAEPPLIQTLYTENFDNFPNPERGFHRYTIFRGLQSSSVSGLRAAGISLILGVVIVNDYKNKDFDAALFNQLNSAFSVARNAGLKVNFRLYYTDQSYQDPPLSRMLSHIDQLQQVFVDNVDVINHVEAGFIGPWGEWHSSNLGNPPTVENMTAVLFRLLSVLPAERMVMIRRPMFKRQIFANAKLPDGYEVLDETKAFDGSNLARTGYHNDAFVTSDTDLGTYVDPGWSRANELAYAGNEARFTPFGGESSYNSPLHDYTHCAYSLGEMETLHARNLNDGWYGPVLQRWTDEGCMDEIKRRLGYRFVLNDVEMSQEVKPGGVLHVKINLNNVGFGSLFNPRDVKLVLQNGSQLNVAAVNCDPRRWEPGAGIALDKYFRIPANILEGYYDVKLNLPDPKTSLQTNPLYSIRLANVGVWESSTGYNVLKTGLQIHNAAPGSSTSDTTFQEIDNPSFTISGRITSGIQSDVTVSLYPNSCTGISETTVTDSQGNYSFNNLPAGTYMIIPEAYSGCNANPMSYENIIIPRTDYNSYDFTLSCGCGN
jgi:hypothetical protein